MDDAIRGDYPHLLHIGIIDSDLVVEEVVGGGGGGGVRVMGAFGVVG